MYLRLAEQLSQKIRNVTQTNVNVTNVTDKLNEVKWRLQDLVNHTRQANDTAKQALDKIEELKVVVLYHVMTVNLKVFHPLITEISVCLNVPYILLCNSGWNSRFKFILLLLPQWISSIIFICFFLFAFSITFPFLCYIYTLNPSHLIHSICSTHLCIGWTNFSSLQSLHPLCS